MTSQRSFVFNERAVPTARMGATGMPSRQGRRHKEVLSPAKRRPSGSRSRPGGSGEEETSPEPHPRFVSAQLARPAPLARTPLPRKTLRLPLPPALLLPPAALEVAGRPGEWPSPNAPQAGSGAGGRGLSSGRERAVPEAEGARGGRGRTCGPQRAAGLPVPR